MGKSKTAKGVKKEIFKYFELFMSNSLFSFLLHIAHTYFLLHAEIIIIIFFRVTKCIIENLNSDVKNCEGKTHKVWKYYYVW